jgi:hypothetical protein
MQWRDVFAGAISTLVVTVLGGVAVFYATKEPDDRKTERLVYSVNQPATFSGGTQDVAFSSVKLENVGGVAAKRVSIRLGLSSAEIRDLSVTAGAGIKELKRDRGTRELSVAYETLLPSETITFNLLLSKSERPVIEIRSEASLARERNSLKDISESPTSRINAIVEKAVPATGVLITLLMAATGVLYLRVRGFTSSKNNAGFLLLHHGLVDDAESTLRSAIGDGDFAQVTLSNYALCRALRGQFDQARGLLRAAAFRGATKHSRAVVTFNEGLVRLLEGDKAGALDSLTKAVSLSPVEVRRYCQRSVHLDAVRDEAAFHDLFKVA